MPVALESFGRILENPQILGDLFAEDSAMIDVLDPMIEKDPGFAGYVDYFLTSEFPDIGKTLDSVLSPEEENKVDDIFWRETVPAVLEDDNLSNAMAEELDTDTLGLRSRISKFKSNRSKNKKRGKTNRSVRAKVNKVISRGKKKTTKRRKSISTKARNSISKYKKSTSKKRTSTKDRRKKSWSKIKTSVKRSSPSTRKRVGSMVATAKKKYQATKKKIKTKPRLINKTAVKNMAVTTAPPIAITALAMKKYKDWKKNKKAPTVPPKGTIPEAEWKRLDEEKRTFDQIERQMAANKKIQEDAKKVGPPDIRSREAQRLRRATPVGDTYVVSQNGQPVTMMRTETGSISVSKATVESPERKAYLLKLQGKPVKDIKWTENTRKQVGLTRSDVGAEIIAAYNEGYDIDSKEAVESIASVMQQGYPTSGGQFSYDDQSEQHQANINWEQSMMQESAAMDPGYGIPSWDIPPTTMEPKGLEDAAASFGMELPTFTPETQSTIQQNMPGVQRPSPPSIDFGFGRPTQIQRAPEGDYIPGETEIPPTDEEGVPEEEEMPGAPGLGGLADLLPALPLKPPLPGMIVDKISIFKGIPDISELMKGGMF